MQKRNKLRNFIWIISGIFILGILGVYAGTTLSNSPVSYLNSDNLTINSTGAYLYDGNAQRGVSSGTADVVVCLGTSVYDDYYKSIKWLSGCDLVCKSTASECNTTLSIAVGTANRYVVVDSGNYYIGAPVILKSNVTLQGMPNTILIANGTESEWSFGLTNIHGILQTFNSGHSDVYSENIKISGFNFINNNKANAIVIDSFTNIKIENNDFTGNSSSGVIYCLQKYANFNAKDLYITNNYFHNYLNSSLSDIILLQTGNNRNLTNVNVEKNTFYKTRGNQITASDSSLDYITDINIINNHIFEIDDAGSTFTKYASLYFGGVTGYQHISNLKIIGNEMRTGYELNLTHGQLFFALFYSTNNSIISNNILDFNILSSNISASTGFLAPGRISTPDYNVIISNNQVKGVSTFWDPDSMVNVDMFDNVIENVGSTLTLGYGTQINVHIHNNIWTNYNNVNYGDILTYNSSIGLAQATTSLNNVIENNLISDFANPSNLHKGIWGTGQDYRNVTIKNNYLYVSTGLPLVQYNSSSNLQNRPNLQGNNFVSDNYTIINSTGGIHRCYTNDSTGGLICN